MYSAATQPALPTGFWDRAPAADVRQAPAAPCHGALWRLGGAPCTTPQQALSYHTLAEGRSWPPQTAEEWYAMTCPWRHKHNPFHRKVALIGCQETHTIGDI